MISLAIPTFNRSEFALQSFKEVLGNPFITEVVLNDDYSDRSIYMDLWNLVHGMKKVKLTRNSQNLGPLMNKYETVKLCKNDWVILLDSDNVINEDYIASVITLRKEHDVLYCPETLWDINKEKVLWEYSMFNSFLITKQNVGEYLKNTNISTCLNTGNFFVNRKEYLRVHETRDGGNWANDAIYFAFLWLHAGNSLSVVRNLYYKHRIHDGSWFKNNSKKCTGETKIIERMLR